MSFLAPLFLLGTAAVAAPILFHLIRRTTRQRTQFSSLMFLKPTVPRLTRRSRLENLLLLLLRCAVLCLLAFAFARPFIRTSAPQVGAAGEGTRTAVLLDTSASMRRDGLWSDALRKAEEVIRKAGAADEVGLFTFSHGLNTVVGFEEWRRTPVSDRAALTVSQLKRTEPGWEETLLDQAIIQAAELTEDNRSEANWTGCEVVVISDLQEGSRLGTLQAHEWPNGLNVRVEQAKPSRAGNAGIQWLTDANDQTTTDTSMIRVRISNAPDSTVEQFQVGWAGGAFNQQALTVYVPAGQSRIVTLDPASSGADTNRIVLQGDGQTFDNQLFVIPARQVEATVLYVGDEEPDDARAPLYFLAKAFPETSRQRVNVVPQRSAVELTTDQLAAADLIVVTDTITDASARVLHKALMEGKTVLMAPRSETAARAIAATVGMDAIVVQEQEPRGYGMLAEIEFAHPLFATFADSRFSDFTGIHFWKYRRLDASAIPHARVLARFDTGDVAILETPVGKGRLFLFTSGWHPADSQLALSSKFVPLMFSLLELSRSVRTPPDQYVVGEAIPLPSERAGNLVLVEPDGSTTPIPAEQVEFTAKQPGVHTVLNGENILPVAVNLAAVESRTAPLAADELEGLGMPLARSGADPVRAGERQVILHNAELETRQKLWRWLLVGAFGMVLVETALAGWTARRSAAPREEPA